MNTGCPQAFARQRMGRVRERLWTTLRYCSSTTAFCSRRSVTPTECSGDHDVMARQVRPWSTQPDSNLALQARPTDEASISEFHQEQRHPLDQRKRRTIQVPREFGCDCRPLAPRKDDRPSRRHLPRRILLARGLNRALLRPFLADGPPYGRNFSRTRYRFAKAKSMTTCAWFFANPR